MLRFSIITPSLNQGRFIKDTIESVLNQNYNNFEHIIIDGGSTDDTINILKKYQHLKWISEKDKGAASAINKGFKMSDGNIITWLNSDDYFENNIFSKINEFFEKNKNIEFLYGNRMVILPDKKIVLPEKTDLQNADILIHNSADIVRQPCSFYRNGLINRVGLLDENLKLVFDYELFIRCFKATTPYYIDENFAYTRDYSNTLTRKNMRRQALEIFKISRKYGAKFTDPIMYNSILKKLIFPGKF